MEWGDSDAREIKEGEKVQLRGFSTGVHGVGTSVSYRYVLVCFSFLLFWEEREGGGEEGERRVKQGGGDVANLIMILVWRSNPSSISELDIRGLLLF